MINFRISDFVRDYLSNKRKEKLSLNRQTSVIRQSSVIASSLIISELLRSPVMSLVRCNGCLGNPPGGFADMHITNCGHVFCTECMKKAIEEGKCRECNSPYLQYVSLGGNLKPDIKLCFQDLGQTISRARNAFAFQAAQYRHLNAMLKVRNHKLEQQLAMAKRSEAEAKSNEAAMRRRFEAALQNGHPVGNGGHDRSYGSGGSAARSIIPEGRISFLSPVERAGRRNQSQSIDSSRGSGSRDLLSNAIVSPLVRRRKSTVVNAEGSFGNQNNTQHSIHVGSTLQPRQSTPLPDQQQRTTNWFGF